MSISPPKSLDQLESGISIEGILSTATTDILMISCDESGAGRDDSIILTGGPASVERLERELRRARVVYETVHTKQMADAPTTQEDASTLSTTEANDLCNQEVVARCVESTNNLSKEMDLAKDDLLEASLRAEKFLAHLELLQDDDESIKRLATTAAKSTTFEQQVQEMASPSNIMGQEFTIPRDGITKRDHGTGIHQKATTVPLDMSSLLRDIQELKLQVKAAKEEVEELRSYIKYQFDAKSANEIHVAKSHQRIDSSTTSRTVPTEVDCTADDSQSNGYYSNHEDGVWNTYVDHHMRISNGFYDENPATPRDFDANWWKGRIDNEGSEVCGGEPCVFGGLVKLIKGRSEVPRRNILS